MAALARKRARAMVHGAVKAGTFMVRSLSEGHGAAEVRLKCGLNKRSSCKGTAVARSRNGVSLRNLELIDIWNGQWGSRTWM